MTTDGTVSTLTFNPASLAANTTYFVRVGSLWNGATSYANTSPLSTSTLTSPIANQQYFQVGVTSVTVNWTAMTVGTGTNTSEGYRLDASTAPDFSGTLFFSSNTTPATSTLTVTGLAAYTTYYFRVGALNWDNVANYTVMSATRTIEGPAVSKPLITSAFVSTLTATWTPAPNTTGYDVEASTMANFTGTIISSVTTNTLAATLSYNPGDLAANTTYFVRIGALYNGTTIYINTVPSSTSTLTSPITTQQYYQVFITSVTVNWAAFGTGPGNNTSEGYELDASTMSDFSGTPLVTSVLSPATSTLTIVGMTPYTPYYFRVGGINYNNVVNYTVMAATRTLVGRAVGSPVINSVYISTLTATWTAAPDPVTGYDVEASTMASFTGTIISSVTSNTSANTLSYNPGDLAANTTYFVRIGALYSGATTYINTAPSSASTLTNLPQNAQVCTPSTALPSR